MKILCRDCNVEKEETDFWKQKRSKNGYQYQCKDCSRLRQGNKPAKVYEHLGIPRICNACLETKDLSQYQLQGSTYDGTCKSCESKERLGKIKLPRQQITVTEKVCRICKQNFPITNFHKRKSSVDGYLHTCKSCHKNHLRAGKVEISTRTTNQKLQSYRGNAKAREIEFRLTRDQFQQLLLGDCTYCGVSSKDANMGIDRAINSIGYEPSNCVSCCTRCNLMKINLDKDQWIEHIIKIYKHCSKQFPNN